MGKKFYEFYEDPEEGMVLVGFTCPAVLEGTELKRELTSLFKEKEEGVRKAVSRFQELSLSTFEESLRVITEMREDFLKEGLSKVISKNYKYTVDRVFWAFEKDIPEDPRYFLLNVVDCRNLDKNTNVKDFIKENIDEGKFNELKDLKKSFSISENG